MSTAVATEVVPDKKAFRVMEAEAVRLAKEVEKGYMSLAEVLSDIKAQFDMCGGDHAKTKRELGYETFDLWVAEKLKFERRKAYYLVSIWASLHVKAKLTKRKIEEMGWTKAKELQGLVKYDKLNAENADEWIEKANTMPTEELKAAVKKKTHPGQVVEIIKRFTIGLFEEQFKNWEAALETARKLTGSDKTPHLIDVICLEFNANHVKEREDKEVLLNRLCASIEENFEVKVIVIDPKKKDVLYGEDEVKSLQ